MYTIPDYLVTSGKQWPAHSPLYNNGTLGCHSLFTDFNLYVSYEVILKSLCIISQVKLSTKFYNYQTVNTQSRNFKSVCFFRSKQDSYNANQYTVPVRNSGNINVF